MRGLISLLQKLVNIIYSVNSLHESGTKKILIYLNVGSMKERFNRSIFVNTGSYRLGY